MALSAGDGVDAHEHGAVAARWRGHVGSAMPVRCGLGEGTVLSVNLVMD